MKNKIIYQLKSKIKLSVKGKNINRFIIRLHKNKIEILKCNHINKEKVNIIIYEKDLEKLESIRTIYNIEKLNTYGMIKIKKKLNLNKYLIISIVLGLIILKTLTSIIFKIDWVLFSIASLLFKINLIAVFKNIIINKTNIPEIIICIKSLFLNIFIVFINIIIIMLTINIEKIGKIISTKIKFK